MRILSIQFHFIGFYPHVAPIEILAEQGLVGLAIYVAIVFITFKSAIRLLSNSTEDTPGSRSAAAILFSLFIFEWLLTFKQGSLLSSIYVFSYAAVICKLLNTTTHVVPVLNIKDERPARPYLKNVMS